MAFRRLTDLSCKISKSISLRLHPEIYTVLKKEADERTLDSGRRISIGDIVRELISEKKGSPSKSIKLGNKAAIVNMEACFYQDDFFLEGIS